MVTALLVVGVVVVTALLLMMSLSGSLAKSAPKTLVQTTHEAQIEHQLMTDDQRLIGTGPSKP